MLSVKICKELQLAGFPQDSQFIYYTYDTEIYGPILKDNIADAEYDEGLIIVCACPMLDELLEAIVAIDMRYDIPLVYDYSAKKWVCTYYHEWELLPRFLATDNQITSMRGIANSPSEAVAMLWLELKAKRLDTE